MVVCLSSVNTSPLLLSNFQNTLAALSPLRSLTLRAPLGNLATSASLDMQIVLSSDERILKLKRHAASAVAWFRMPAVLVILVSCKDIDTYRKLNLRAAIRQAIDGFFGQQPQQQLQQQQVQADNNNDSAAAAATTTTTSSPDSPSSTSTMSPSPSPDDTGVPSPKGPLGSTPPVANEWIIALDAGVGTGAAKVWARVREDFGPVTELSQSARLKQTVSFGTQPRAVAGRERLCLLAPGTTADSQAASVVPLLRACMDRSLAARWTAYDDELRRLELGRGVGGGSWSFGAFYLVKESLALALASAGLFDDALRQYRELEVCLQASLVDPASASAEHTANDVHHHQTASSSSVKNTLRRLKSTRPGTTRTFGERFGDVSSSPNILRRSISSPQPRHNNINATQDSTRDPTSPRWSSPPPLPRTPSLVNTAELLSAAKRAPPIRCVNGADETTWRMRKRIQAGWQDIPDLELTQYLFDRQGRLVRAMGQSDAEHLMRGMALVREGFDELVEDAQAHCTTSSAADALVRRIRAEAWAAAAALAIDAWSENGDRSGSVHRAELLSFAASRLTCLGAMSGLAYVRDSNGTVSSQQKDQQQPLQEEILVAGLSGIAQANGDSAGAIDEIHSDDDKKNHSACTKAPSSSAEGATNGDANGEMCNKCNDDEDPFSFEEQLLRMEKESAAESFMQRAAEAEAAMVSRASSLESPLRGVPSTDSTVHGSDDVAPAPTTAQQHDAVLELLRVAGFAKDIASYLKIAFSSAQMAELPPLAAALLPSAPLLPFSADSLHKDRMDASTSLCHNIIAMHLLASARLLASDTPAVRKAMSCQARAAMLASSLAASMRSESCGNDGEAPFLAAVEQLWNAQVVHLEHASGTLILLAEEALPMLVVTRIALGRGAQAVRDAARLTCELAKPSFGEDSSMGAPLIAPALAWMTSWGVNDAPAPCIPICSPVGGPISTFTSLPRHVQRVVGGALLLAALSGNTEVITAHLPLKATMLSFQPRGAENAGDENTARGGATAELNAEPSSRASVRVLFRSELAIDVVLRDFQLVMRRDGDSAEVRLASASAVDMVTLPAYGDLELTLAVVLPMQAAMYTYAGVGVSVDSVASLQRWRANVAPASSDPCPTSLPILRTLALPPLPMRSAETLRWATPWCVSIAARRVWTIRIVSPSIGGDDTLSAASPDANETLAHDGDISLSCSEMPTDGTSAPISEMTSTSMPSLSISLQSTNLAHVVGVAGMLTYTVRLHDTASSAQRPTALRFRFEFDRSAWMLSGLEAGERAWPESEVEARFDAMWLPLKKGSVCAPTLVVCAAGESGSKIRSAGQRVTCTASPVRAFL